MTRFTMRCPKMRTTRMTPEPRMNTQPHFSRLTPLRRGAGVRGAAMVSAVMSVSSGELGHDDDHLARHEAGHDDDPQGQHTPPQLALVRSGPAREVDEDDAQPVERVVR